MKKQAISILLIASFISVYAEAGPYNQLGINGYVGDDFLHADPVNDADARLNPIIKAWAVNCPDYNCADGVFPVYQNPNLALGPILSGLGPEIDEYYKDVVCLGDRDNPQLPPGNITLSFAEPNIITNHKGYDFAVFENGFIISEDSNSVYGYPAGQIFAELAYVEVSSNGTDFQRFPTASLTTEPLPHDGTIDMTDIHNLAGRHPSNGDTCKATPYDLQQLADSPNVLNGSVDINNIKYVRIVDVIGSGSQSDHASVLIDANTGPNWQNYDTNHPVYDPWPTTGGTGGFDLQAIAVLKPQQYRPDINLDGIVNYRDLDIFCYAWLSRFGDKNFYPRCDLARPGDLTVDLRDFVVLSRQWRKKEKWRD